MRVVVVVDYLNVYGGAERTLEAILEIYPEADVFTSLYDPSKFRPESPIRKAKVISVFDGDHLFFERPEGVEKLFHKLVLDFARTIKSLVFLLPKHLTFLMPFFFERLDLADYDLIISVGTIWAKGVKTNSKRQKHIFYCLTPPRFLYGYPSETSKRNVWYYRPFTIVLDHWLRIWDFNAAQKPDQIVSISHEVRRRVKKFYRRDSKVIYPPAGVEASVERLEVSKKNETSLSPLAPRSYFLIVSRLAAYKGIDMVVKICNGLKLPLKIVGTGREGRGLKETAGPTVEFLGFRSDSEIDELYNGAKALIFPTPDEDFGIVPLEANGHGLPVIAHRSGGPLETLVEGKTTIYFKDVDELKKVLESFDEKKFNPLDCIQNAQRFSQERFQNEFKSNVLGMMKK